MVVEEAGKMDTVEVTKMIDGVYKNILDNFNPTSRQMIAAGKAYLKSLHGASASCSMYLDSLVKLSRQAQQSSFGCSSDIGSSLMQVSEVFKEIHTQQLNTLKAFYVDFLAPLEANLEKDTRVIQGEQKKFLMCHKQKVENFTKAASTVKKMRKKTKKSNNSSTQFDKELKVMQAMEEERGKLESFCEKSMKEALIQERRRYGFILERKASLAKHYVAFYYKGSNLLQPKLEAWNKLAKSRETLPEPMQNALLKRIQGGGNGEDECIYCNPPNKQLAQKLRSSSIGAAASLTLVRAGGGGGGLILLRQQSVSAKHTPSSSHVASAFAFAGTHAHAHGSADDSSPCTSFASHLRKSKSMDASEIVNVTCEQDLPIMMSHGAPVTMPNGAGAGSGGCNGAGTLCRAKSDLNLGTNNNGHGNSNGGGSLMMSTAACCNGHMGMQNANNAASGPDASESYIIETAMSGMLSPSSSSSPSHQSAFHEPAAVGGGGTLMRQHQHGAGGGAGSSGTMTRPKSLALIGSSADTGSGCDSNGGGNGSGNGGFVKARYAYLSSGENQLCFLEGDAIALIGERNNGWQYGENLRTQKTGWFPIAYTEADCGSQTGSGNVNTIMNGHGTSTGGTTTVASCHSNSSAEEGFCSLSPIPPPMPPALPTPIQQHAPSCSFQQKRMNLADVLVHRHSEQSMMKTSGIKSLPSTPAGCCSGSGLLKSPGTGAGAGTSAGTPLQNGPSHAGSVGAGVSTTNSSTQTLNTNMGMMIHNHNHGHNHPPPPATTPTANSGRSASDSLHSSNDSGFSNDLNNQHGHGHGAGAGAGAGGPMLLHMLPPPQPDVDYSDDEPQLSNSQEFKSGDEWLMDKYHKSESIRLGLGEPLLNHIPPQHLGNGNTNNNEAVPIHKMHMQPGSTRPRRSLSFGNVSGWENMHPSGLDDHNTLRDRISRHQYHHEQHYLPSGMVNGRHVAGGEGGGGGVLKKFINRTKSFIWKKKDDDPEFDSVSVLGSLADIWGSHNSLVDVNYVSKNSYEMKELNNPNGNKQMLENDAAEKERAEKVSPTKPRREALPSPPPPPAQVQAPTSISTKTSSAKSNGESRNTLQYQGTKGKSKGRRLAPVDSNSESETPIIPTAPPSSKHRSTGPAAMSNGKKYRSKLHSASSAGGMRTLDTPNPSSASTRHHRTTKNAKHKQQTDQEDEGEYNTVEFEDETEAEAVEEAEVDTNLEDDDNASSVFIQQSASAHKKSSSKKNGSASNGVHYLVKSNSFRRKLRLGGSSSPKSNTKKSQSMRISHATFATTTTSVASKGKNSSSVANQSTDKRYRLVSPPENGAHAHAPTSTSMDIAKLNNTIVTTLQSVAPKSRIKGSIHSEFHTVELIATDDDDSDESAQNTTTNDGNDNGDGKSKSKKGKGKGTTEPMFEYGNQIHRRLYCPERSSKLDQKSERSGNLCGPWYDLWGCDNSVTFA